MKSKLTTIFLSILLMLGAVTSCNGPSTPINPSTTSSINANEITVNNSDIKALINTSFDLVVNNESGDKIEYEQSSFDIFSATQTSANSFKLNFIKEGKATLRLRTLNSNEVIVNIEVIDLSITNTEDHIDVGESLQILLSRDVNATYEVDSDIASVSSSGLLSVHKEGEFELRVNYGLINLTKTFDSFPRLDKLEILNKENKFIKYLGRNVFIDGMVQMNNIASGFEVTFFGTMLKASFEAMYRTYYGVTRLSILVDGEKDTNNRIVALDSSLKQEYVLVSGLELGLHTVKVLKRTEALSTYLSLYDVSTDGYFKVVDASRKLRLEAYGDSITAGYGNLRGELADQTSSEYQNGLQTYATYSASALEADINVQARSGLGLYTSANIEETMQLNRLFEYVNYDANYKWNMENYIPDIVLINIGTNDYWNSGIFNETTFISEYVSFVSRLANIYGNKTKFILLSGLMENNVKNALPSIKETLTSNLNNEIHTLVFNQCSAGHPRFEEHLAASNMLVDYIKNNHLDHIDDEIVTPINIEEAGEEMVDLSLVLKTYDETPSHIDLYVKGLGESAFKLNRENEFTFSLATSIKEGDYEIRVFANSEEHMNNKSYKLQVRKNNNNIKIKLDSFMSYPIDEHKYDDTFGWYMGYHAFTASFNAVSESKVVVTNPTNWLAAMVLKDTSLKDNYSIEATISTSSYDADSYMGFVPYYVNDLNYIVVYLQFDASLKLRGVGSTGIIDGQDIGFSDYSEFIGEANLNTGKHVKVARNGCDLSVSIGEITLTQRFYTMKHDTKAVGLYEVAPNSVTYDDISIKECDAITSAKWTKSPCLFDETIVVKSDSEVEISNFTNWMAGFALTPCAYVNNYSISANVSSSKDYFIDNEDVQIALVPFFSDTNNFVVVYLQWDKVGKIKSIGITGKLDSVDLGWNDIWTFAGLSSSLISGESFKVTRTNTELSVEYGGVKASQFLPRLANKKNYAIGVWAHNAVACFSDILVAAL